MGRRCRIFAVLVGIAALTVACVPPTETPSAPKTSTTTSAAPDSGPSVVTPLLASVIAPPIPVPATDGKVHLAYELLLDQRAQPRADPDITGRACLRYHSAEPGR